MAVYRELYFAFGVKQIEVDNTPEGLLQISNTPRLQQSFLEYTSHTRDSLEEQIEQWARQRG
jgi:hypothetical protein